MFFDDIDFLAGFSFSVICGGTTGEDDFSPSLGRSAALFLLDDSGHDFSCSGDSPNNVEEREAKLEVSFLALDNGEVVLTAEVLNVFAIATD